MMTECGSYRLQYRIGCIGSLRQDTGYKIQDTEHKIFDAYLTRVLYIFDAYVTHLRIFTHIYAHLNARISGLGPGPGPGPTSVCV